MTDPDDDLCGYEDTTTGHPCQNLAGSCPWHNTDDPPSTGRPSKLTDERVDTICSSIAQGKSVTSAARMAGVSRNAVYSWIEKGDIEDDGPYAEFHDRLSRAKGHGEDFYFGLALELAIENEDHRFIASLMKQRYPESWGSTETGVDADIVEVVLPESARLTQPRQDGNRQ